MGCSDPFYGSLHDLNPLDICEIFPSIQGEGKDCGTHALFIRLAGCNRRCPWCDTKRSWEPGTPYTQDEVLREIERYTERFRNNYIVWTGGEPFLQELKIQNIVYLTRANIYHHVETNGTIVPDKPQIFNSISVSPKDGFMDRRWITIKTAVIKLVVENIHEAETFLEQYDLPLSRFYVMAKSIPDEDELIKEQHLAAECANRGYNFSPRLQALFHWGVGR